MKQEYTNILLIKMSSLGDVIHTLPFVYELRKLYPKARITWLVHPQFGGFIPMQIVDEVLYFDKVEFGQQSWIGKIKTGLKMRELLRSKHFDLVIDLQGLFKSAALAAISGCSNRIGYAEMREGSGLVSKAIVGAHKDDHVIERYLDVVRYLGAEVEQVEFPLPDLSQEEEQVKSKLADHGCVGKYFVIVPGARWETKCWPAEHYATLIKELVKHDNYVVLAGGKDDEVKGQEIAKLVASDKCIDLTGQTTLKELVALIKDSDLYISADTGPLHFAAALKKPLVCMYGPTKADRTGPYGGDNQIIILSPAQCAGCLRKQCDNWHCMYDITPQMVLDGVAKLTGQTFDKIETSKNLVAVPKKRILVTFLMQLGDLVLTTPFVHALRKAEPEAHITFLCDEKLKDVMRYNPNLDEVMTLDRYGKDNSVKKLWQAGQRLGKMNFDLLINLQSNERLSFLGACTKVKVRAGTAHKLFSIFWDKFVPLNRTIHAAKMYVEVLSKLGYQNLEENGLEIFLGDEFRAGADRFWQEQGLQEQDRLVGFNIGSAVMTKRWAPERFAQVADAIMDKGIKVVFFGGKMDEQMVSEAVNHMHHTPIIATGKFGIGELAAAMGRCELIVTNDSGPMHVAISQKVPIVALYGPSHIDLYGPYKADATVITAQPPCDGCRVRMKHKCSDMRCMTALTVDQVLEAVFLKLSLVVHTCFCCSSDSFVL